MPLATSMHGLRIALQEACYRKKYLLMPYLVIIIRIPSTVSNADSTSIADPTTLDANPNFETLLEILEDCLDHKYLSCLLMMGAGVACFHYQEILKLFRFCLQVMNGHWTNFYRKVNVYTSSTVLIWG